MTKFKLSGSRLIIVILSGTITFYTAKITQASPIYIIYLLLFPLAVVFIIKRRYISFQSDAIIAFVLLIYIVLTQLQFLLSGEFINLFISLFAYMYIRSNKNILGEVPLINIFHTMQWISIIVLTIDSAYRLTHPAAPTAESFAIMEASESLWFYIYKFNSLMFADSNTTALIALVLYFSIYSIQVYMPIKSYKYEKLFLILLILLSFSRAAIIALIFGMLFISFHKLEKYWRLIFSFIIILLVFSIFLYLISYLGNDGSLNSKFHIISLVYEKIFTLSLSQFMFGIGFSNVENFLGIYSHLLLLTYLIETGLIGLALFILFIIVYTYKYNFIILFPVMIASLSYFLYVGAPFLFVPLALTANIIDLKRRQF
jgi:hypothetical protein